MNVAMRTSHKVLTWACCFVTIGFLLLWGGHTFFDTEVDPNLANILIGVSTITIGAYMAKSGFEKKVNAQYNVNTITSTTVEEGTKPTKSTVQEKTNTEVSGI